MITLKPGVRVLGLRPEIVLALAVANGAFGELGLDVVVTSGIDGTHARGSEHYTGLAVDLRMVHVPVERRATLVQRIAFALGTDYDVLHESVNAPGEHLHIEYDPKAPY